MGAGKALKEISSELRIRADHLRAIEEGDYQRLPGPAYVAGFVRSYANYLGFDGTEIVAQVREETAPRDLKQDLVFPEPVYEGRMPAGPVVLVSGLAAVLVLVTWIALSGDHRQAGVVVPAVPERLTSLTTEPGAPVPSIKGGIEARDPSPSLSPTTAMAPASASQETATQETAMPENAMPETATQETATQETAFSAALAGGLARLTIRARDDAWMSIRKPQGEPLFEGILRAGESIDIPGGNNLTITTGNAGYLEIAVNGTPVEALGPVGAVIRDLSLAPGDLRPADRDHRR